MVRAKRKRGGRERVYTQQGREREKNTGRIEKTRHLGGSLLENKKKVRGGKRMCRGEKNLNEGGPK